MPEIGHTVNKALREELDLHSAFIWTNYLRESINAHFNARYMGPPPDRIEYTIIPSEFWTLPDPKKWTTDGRLICSANRENVALYSKEAWRYGWATFRTKLPTFTVNLQNFWMGLENGAAQGNGRVAFFARRDAGILNLYVNVDGLFTADRFINITNFLPADATTVIHTYTVHISKSQAEFYIDGILRAVCINSPGLAFADIAGPPYALCRSNVTFTTRLRGLIELSGLGTELVSPLNPGNVRLSHGDPVPPRVYRLYKAGTETLLAGLIINAPVTSHPFPLFGFEAKTLYLMANQIASPPTALQIELLMESGTWRVYDDAAVAANTLTDYHLQREAVLGRITFTPDAYPCTISEAEVVLR